MKDDEEYKAEKSKLEEYFDKKNITSKKIIKGTTLLMGIVLIGVMTLANVIIDPKNLNFFKWLTNSLILLGILIFGIAMGESVGEDKQRDAKGGLYQFNLKKYNTIRTEITPIDIYFAQFYLWFKEKEYERKKLNYLLDNSFEGHWARDIVKYLDKGDLPFMEYTGGYEKIYVKDGHKIKKCSKEEYEVLKEMFELKLNAYSYSYFLTAFGGATTSGVLEQGKRLDKKLKTDKRYNRAIKITTALFTSLVIGMATTKDFAEGEAVAAWVNLVSRLTGLLTAFFSGYSSAVISVKTEAAILDNKTSVLKDFQTCYVKKEFMAETYEQQVDRMFNEQKDKVRHDVCETPEVIQIENKVFTTNKI